MKKVIISVAMGLYMAVAAGSVFASEPEGRGGRGAADQYESKVFGTIRSIPQGMLGIWNVNGRIIYVTQNTIIKEKYGKAKVGAYVEVEGTPNGNMLHANKIEVKRDSREVRSPSKVSRRVATGY